MLQRWMGMAATNDLAVLSGPDSDSFRMTAFPFPSLRMRADPSTRAQAVRMRFNIDQTRISR